MMMSVLACREESSWVVQAIEQDAISMTSPFCRLNLSASRRSSLDRQLIEQVQVAAEARQRKLYRAVEVKSPRAIGAPHSARAVKVPSRETGAVASRLAYPSDVDAIARASRDGRVGVDASMRRSA